MDRIQSCKGRPGARAGGGRVPATAGGMLQRDVAAAGAIRARLLHDNV